MGLSSLGEAERSRMADDDRAGGGGRVGTDLAKRGAGLVDQKIDRMLGALRTQGPQAPQESLAGKGGVGAQRQRPHHVGAAAHAAVEKDGRPASDLRGDGG